MKSLIMHLAMLVLCMTCAAEAQNPQLLSDIYPGTTGCNFMDGELTPNQYLFGADNGTNGREIWRTDGTPSGTYMLKDVYAGTTTGLYNFSAISYNNAPAYPVFLAANTSATGIELFKTNGTAAGTVLVKDIFRGKEHSQPFAFTRMNGITYFRASVAQNKVPGSRPATYIPDAQLLRTDGTSAGTYVVKDLAPNNISGSWPLDLCAFNNVLYYFSNVDGYALSRFCRSDGTASGTFMLADAGAPTYYRYSRMLGIGSVMYFRADDGANGYELWRSDGTAAGTQMLKDIHSTGSGNPAFLVNLNGTLYFTADDGVHGIELWKSDGSTGGTVMVADINPSGSSDPSYLTPHNGTLYFTAVGPDQRRQLWKSDGSATGTTLVHTINATGNCAAAHGQSPDPYYWNNQFPVIGNDIYFCATDGIYGYELWKSDGSATGTAMVADLNPGAANASPGHMRVFNGKLLFLATHVNYGAEPWVYDPTLPVPKSSAQYASVPTGLTLHQNYPNPFGMGTSSGTGVTTISWSVDTDAQVEMKIFDMLGREVATLLDGAVSAGTQTRRFDAGALPTGSYLLRATSGGQTQTRIMLHVK